MRIIRWIKRNLFKRKMKPLATVMPFPADWYEATQTELAQVLKQQGDIMNKAEWEKTWKKQHAQAFKVASATIGAEQATIAQGIYRFVSEKYPDADHIDLAQAMWLAMQMVVGPMRAADAVRQGTDLRSR